MANRTGLVIRDGKVYIDGVEFIGGHPVIDNTFSKICVYGSSIECNPADNYCWPKVMADILGLSYGSFDKTKQVVNYGYNGGNVTWYGDSYPSDGAVHLFHGFSCTDAEKESAAASFVSQDKITQEQLNAAKANKGWGLSYDESVLGQNADLYIFGTYGINDRQDKTYLKWTDEYGQEQNTYTCHSDLAYDPRTIYGAYNRVLKALYQENPNAKVVILGQHSFLWPDQDIVNGIQQAVAERWQIPFLNWCPKMGMYPVSKKMTNVTIEISGQYVQRKRSIYNGDEIHPNYGGARLMGTLVADWITHTELKPLNERFTDITHE